MISLGRLSAAPRQAWRRGEPVAVPAGDRRRDRRRAGSRLAE
jgi:hypothetical protein